MLTRKYETAGNISLGSAMYFHRYGIAIVVTDGKYTQSEKEGVEDGRKKENCT